MVGDEQLVPHLVRLRHISLPHLLALRLFFLRCLQLLQLFLVLGDAQLGLPDLFLHA